MYLCIRKKIMYGTFSYKCHSQAPHYYLFLCIRNILFIILSVSFSSYKFSTVCIYVLCMDVNVENLGNMNGSNLKW